MAKEPLRKSQLIDYTNQGLNRDEIAEKLKISKGELNNIFKHFGLKIKAKKMTYELIDDLKENTSPVDSGVKKDVEHEDEINQNTIKA